MLKKFAGRLLTAEDGTTVVEMALVSVGFLGMLLGSVNFGMVLWTQNALQYAVEAAARCSAVNATTCGTTSAVETYAQAQYFGEPLSGTNPFSYSASGCGHTVSASYTYSLTIPLYGTYSLPLSATACFP
jgi:hypothetical protein